MCHTLDLEMKTTEEEESAEEEEEFCSPSISIYLHLSMSIEEKRRRGKETPRLPPVGTIFFPTPRAIMPASYQICKNEAKPLRIHKNNLSISSASHSSLKPRASPKHPSDTPSRPNVLPASAPAQSTPGPH